MLDLSLEDDLKTRFRNLPRVDSDELTELVKDPRMILGAHDAAAHVDMLCDSCYPSYTLRYWVREQGVFSLEEAIWRMSGQPAEVWGMTNRGLVKEGYVADLVAFDPETITETRFERVYDFPAGGERLISRNEGIRDIWVAGVAIQRDGKELEGVMPGSVVNS
jgi:N-acyl-D-aspartate/D-glutamate deacylase